MAIRNPRTHLLKTKIVLVRFWLLDKPTPTMKRFYTLIVLLGLAMGVLTGCNKPEGGTTTTETNAPAVTPAPSTNAPAK